MSKAFSITLLFLLANAICAQPDCLRTQRHGIESISRSHPIVWVTTGDTISVETATDGETIYTVDGFWISCEEITRDLWKWYYHQDWSRDANDDLPATGMSSEQLDSFLVMLSRSTKLTWQLPTRDEWLFAFHGGLFGDNYLFSGSNRHILVAWSKANSGKCLHPVGERIPNELDIYDMSGNAAEMVTVGDSIVCIGGCYLDDFSKEVKKNKGEQRPMVAFPMPTTEARGFRPISHQPLKFNTKNERVF